MFTTEELHSITIESIMECSTIEDSLNKDAEIFLKGNCHIFALALKDEFGYPIYKWDTSGCHYFLCYSYISLGGGYNETFKSQSIQF